VLSEPIPVLALTIFNSSKPVLERILPESQILIVVRDPATNLRHPNVVSMPTQKVPISLIHDIQTQGRMKYASGDVSYYDGTVFSNRSGDCNNPILYGTQSLLCSKLGLAEPLEKGLFKYYAKIATVISGTVLHPMYPSGTESEHMTMVNLIVGIEDGHTYLPQATSSYSRILWTNVKSFQEMVLLKDPTIADDSLDAIDYCVHGLCIASAQAVIDQ